MVVYSIYVLFMLSILIMTWVWCGGRVCMYRVFSGHAKDQTQCKLCKQCDISQLTPPLCGPGAKLCG
jgi:hypothetical protein